MTNWPTKKLGGVLDYEQPGKYIVSSKNYSREYKTPVLTAGKTFILGNTDEKENIFPVKKLPVIIFDDFTTAIKFVDFPFKVKSSAMKILHARKDIVDIKYVFYAMQTIGLNHATHKRYWISEYSNLKIPLPPLSEQKKIVAKLERVLAKINSAKKFRAEAQEAAKNLLPAELHHIFNSKIKNQNAKLQFKIQNWEDKELGSVAKLVRGPFGGSLKKEIFVNDGDCVYEQGNVIDSDLENFRYRITPEKFEEMKRFAISAGDILMSCSGTIGRFVIIPKNFKKGIINQALLKITPNQKVIAAFLKYALEEYLSLNNTHVKGMAIKNIAAVKELKKIKIPLPPLDEQKRIVKHLDSLSQKLQKLQEYQKSTQSDLLTLEQSVLQKAFLPSVLSRSIKNT